ncbi:Sip1-related alpha-galactosidase [Bifidobacterium cuniculi]|uniref:Alpha-galactosidase n=1 Tax=Bifidobacterium cuniculi TaxID=1688 RepID=A0A087AJM9_9BIFI|nr:Sip1-related alpha-galactosidase [Bifidobacterium cuniculi]KFI58979.1 alpha-galactosidase [Bifidobacterium cuniculi]
MTSTTPPTYAAPDWHVVDAVAQVEEGPAGQRRRLPLDAQCVRVAAEPADGFAGVSRLAAISVDAMLPGERNPILDHPVYAPLRSLTARLAPPAHDGPILCVAQHKEWWMRPFWCDDWTQVPARTQLLLWRQGSGDDGVSPSVDPAGRADGPWHLALAACDGDLRADWRGGDGGGLLLDVSVNQAGHDALAGMCAVTGQGDDPYALVHAAVARVAQATGIRLRGERPFPAALEGLGWCTWDAFGQDVSQAAIVAKMEEFRAKGVPVSWVLIDDGWSQVDRGSSRLVGFDADPVRFPDGLSATVRLLKEEYGVRSVGVWQAFQGYWAGLDPQGPAAGETRAFLERMPGGCLVPAAGAAGAFGFWHRWDARLAEAGIDFAKVDSQGSMSLMARGVQDFGTATAGRHAGLDAAAAQCFSGALINCMGVVPENYWRRPSSPLTRTSDDFFPREPASLPEHAIENAYCSLLLGELYHCDWDMFWTDHPHARTHALLRWISGGPVYCSDAPGATDADLLRLFLDDGGSLPRPDGVGVPVEESLLADPTSTAVPLGIRNTFAGRRFLLFVGLNPDLPQQATIGADDGVPVIVSDPVAHTYDTLAPGEHVSFEVPYGEAAIRFLDPVPQYV